MGEFALDQIVGSGGAVMLRPRICYVLSLLRIHNPDCKHCAARLICGNELRKRLEELNDPMQAISDRFPEAGGHCGQREDKKQPRRPSRTATRNDTTECETAERSVTKSVTGPDWDIRAVKGART